MATHYQFYPSADRGVIPFNASYQFPTVANKAQKVLPRLPPKNGSVFKPNSQIRLEFPAQGYLNGAGTTLEFDLTLQGHTNENPAGFANFSYCIWCQNVALSVFDRMRLLYGSTVLEEILECGYLVRQLTEFTVTGQLDQASISEGIAGGYRRQVHSITQRAAAQNGGLYNTGYPHYLSQGGRATASRRYQVSLPFGLLNGNKLIPIKFMASQLAIELTCTSVEKFLMHNTNVVEAASPAGVDGAISYEISNVNLIPEMLEMDASYDATFLEGLQAAGIPIHFASWNTYTHPINGKNLQVAIQERGRSIKGVFAFVRKTDASLKEDYGASFGDIENKLLYSYQYRIGGRYFPASPCIVNESGVLRNSGCEAFVEMQKALAILNDRSQNTNANILTWNAGHHTIAAPHTGWTTVYGNDDYQLYYPVRQANGVPVVGADAMSFAGTEFTPKGSSCFCMAINLETTNGREISGLNAEEQSDIDLLIKWHDTPPSSPGFELVIYTLSDRLIVLHENNTMELIT